MNIYETINSIENKNKIIKPKFNTGDTISINFKITEKGYKDRTQTFEGLVLAIKKTGINSTCTLRKISFGEGVEKTFFINSPTINWIKIKKYGLTRKSKLYYIKNLKGKAAKIKEKLVKRRDARVA